MKYEKGLSVMEAKKLADELSALTAQQYDAERSEAYLGMSKVEADEYGQRRARIRGICLQLGKFRPK
jgi:hypothetical protein